MWIVTEENKSAVNLSEAIGINVEKETKREKWHVRAEFPVTENELSFKFETVKYTLGIFNTGREAQDYVKHLFEKLAGKK